MLHYRKCVLEKGKVPSYWYCWMDCFDCVLWLCVVCWLASRTLASFASFVEYCTAMSMLFGVLTVYSIQQRQRTRRWSGQRERWFYWPSRSVSSVWRVWRVWHAVVLCVVMGCRVPKRTERSALDSDGRTSSRYQFRRGDVGEFSRSNISMEERAGEFVSESKFIVNSNMTISATGQMHLKWAHQDRSESDQKVKTFLLK